MISPHRIKYRGVESTELNILDLIMCVAFDSDNGETGTYLNREAVASETYDGRYKRVHGYKYSESFSPKFTFMKKDFGNFTIEEVRQVIKWLTSADTTALLDVYYDDSNEVAWSAIGGWTEISAYKFANNRTVGIVATFEAVTPYAMSDLYTVAKTIATPTNTTMYRWAATATSGTVPQYFLTSKNTLSVGDILYTFTGNASAVINKDSVSAYGKISAKNDATYTVNNATFTASTSTAVTIQDMNNKIIIEIDTDDNRPICPRITINQKGSIVRIPSGTTLTYLSDMIENTAYFNGATYYWKTENSTDPIYFHSSNTNPNLSTTSVKFTNTHTDFLNQPTVLASTIVKNNNITELITLDGANKIVSSNSTRRIFGDDFNFQYLELYDGKNEITVEGNCDITLEWREVRKVGEY